MRIVALDVGSSSVKGAILSDGRIVGRPVRAVFPTDYSDGRAEVRPRDVLRAITQVIGELSTRGIDMLALCAMAPSWIAVDKKGRPITNVITHQDRRSIDVARELEKAVGKQRYLKLAGNRPFPGGISSTTAAWFARHYPSVIQSASLVGHLSTFLLHRWTGARVTDPSNASFMGVYRTTTLGGWSDELLDAVGLRRDQMPEVIDATRIAGQLAASAARELGLPAGTPVLPGIMDTSAAVLLRGARNRLLFNVSGSTDVLALCVDDPVPHEQLLTRAVGVGRKWMAVSTIASTGTTLSWLHRTLFSELPEPAFYRVVRRALRASPGGVSFEPYLAGDRMSIEQRTADFHGLTLSTTREQMLAAALDAMARASAARIPLFLGVYGRISREVTVTGGVGEAIAQVLHRDWPGRWRFRPESEATLRGLYVVAQRARK